MEYMLDTNILIYITTDHSWLDKEVVAIMQDSDNQFCISAETLRELVVAFNNKGFNTKRWKTSADMIYSIETDYAVRILPIDKNVMKTYSHLTLNTHAGHKAPSYHVIISHALTLKMPLISSDTLFPFYRKQGLDLIFNKK